MGDRIRGRPVVVVGLMGSGKTSVATRLATALGRPLRDSDPDLHARHGLTAAQLVDRYGAEALHLREADHLCAALDEVPPPVIAAAASVVDNAQCRAELGRAAVVWLDAPPEVLAERMRAGDHRPHFDPDLPRMLAAQYDRRAHWFRDLADVVVDVSETSPDQAATAALVALAGAPGPG